VRLPCILIPAYQPDEKLVELVRALKNEGFVDLIVVDDGGGPLYESLFEQCSVLGCTILRHGINMGKGRALKTGLNYYLTRGYPGIGVITADSDGQHTPIDIHKVADAMAEAPDTFVLGTRHFTTNVPLRSRFGNGVTRRFFALINGETVTDTQTGLRGLPDALVPLFLSLSGERYEYEMNMLLAIRPNGLKLKQIPIETIYINNNHASHFNTIRDSARIYRLIFAFVLSSLLAAAIDYSVFIAMTLAFPGRLLLSVVTARVCSSMVNYLINHNLVFRQKNTAKTTVFRYYALVVFIMLLSYGMIHLLNNIVGINVYLAKLISDITLYFVSFLAQRDFVYRNRKI
jgi:putative flippase GtrA